MKIQSFTYGLIILSIVSSGALLANAQNNISTPPASSSSSSPQTTPPQSTDSTQPAAPVTFTLTTTQDIFGPNAEIPIEANFTAQQPVTLCLNREQPELDFGVEVYRGGAGKLKIPPEVVQLSRKEISTIKNVTLSPGQNYRVIFNLKNRVPSPVLFWKPGEYQIQAAFFLCGKQNQPETKIPASEPLRFMIEN